MRAAKPAMPPQTAVTARPRTGSSSFIANRAPATAPKNEAAHAKKGVSSQPKMRKNKRTQRIGSGPSSSYRGNGQGEYESRQEGDCEGAQTPVSSGKTQSDRRHGGKHR